MAILDLSSDLMDYNNLIGDTSSISKMMGIIAIIMLIGTIVILPIFMYLKYLMDIKIVKKGTLQALNEFYNNQPQKNTASNNNQQAINNIDNIEKEDIL